MCATHGAADNSRTSLLNQVLADYLAELEQGRTPNREAFLNQHPDLSDDLNSFFANHDRMTKVQAEVGFPPHDGEAPTMAPGTSIAESAPTVQGDFGDYELLEEIARGGMGVVYKARQKRLNRIVALKMILSGQLATEEDVQRFFAEAEAAARLDHPGIVPIYEVGHRDGQHFFSMSFIEGDSLADRLAAGPVSPNDAAQWTQQICEAVSCAHNHGVIHRDLKPANILLGIDGRPRLTDFGLAKRIEGEHHLTATGQVLGTPSYMPPEQAAGAGKETGPQSDVYSIGAVLYECLAGRPPFRGATPLETLMQVLDNQPAPPRLLNPTVPRDLETICLKCLEKEPRRRYRTAADLQSDVEKFLDGAPISAASLNLVDRVTRALGQTRHEEQFRHWGAALFLLGLIVFAAHVWMFVMEQTTASPFMRYWTPRAVMFAALLALLCYFRPRALLPTNTAERLVWVIWSAYLLATGCVNLVLQTRGHDSSEIFLYTSILSGMGFFIMGAHVWGGSYVIGMVFFAAAPILAYFDRFSSLVFGTLWGGGLWAIGWHYWKRK